MGIAISLSIGCSSMNIKSEYDDSLSMASYHSYAWGKSQTQSPITNEMIRSSISSELVQRGYKQAKIRKKADLIVNYRSFFSQKVASNDLEFAFGQQPGVAEGYGGEAPAAFPYEEAEFDLTLVDSRTGKVIWQSSGTRVLQYDDVSRDQVADAIARIFDHFPIEKS
jgi:hypothetical protein